METSAEPGDEDVKFLEDRVNEHKLRRTTRRDFRPLAIIERDQRRAIIAGLYTLRGPAGSKSSSCGSSRTSAATATAAARASAV